MKALWIEGPGRIALRDVPAPVPPAGECLIRLRQAGICRTDQELLAGYAGFSGIPGHEFVGVVEDGPAELRGRRVVGEINVPRDLACYAQPGFDPRHHPERTVLGIRERPGAFAELLCLPPQNLLPVPDEVSDDQAVFVEPVAAAMAIREQLALRPGARALVIGDGKLGLLIAQVLVDAGQRTTLHGRHHDKLALARGWGVSTRRIGRDRDIDGAMGDPGDEPGGHAGGEPGTEADRFPLVVEATGSPAGFEAALALVQPRGTIVLKSTYAPGHMPAIDTTRIVVDELRIQGSRCGRFAPALACLAGGRLDVTSLIGERYPLAQGVAAFAAAARPGARKVLLGACSA